MKQPAGETGITQWEASTASHQSPPPGWQQDAPTLMCATDQGYVQPLAASLASVCQFVSQDRDATPWLQLVLLDGGMDEPSWSKFSGFLNQLRIRTIRVRAGAEAVSHLAISHHISHTAYFRLLSSQWLPDWIDRVIYLDCDTIVQDDLTRLWDETQGDDHEVWAVPDVACPFIDARRGCADYERFGPYLAAITPVANYRELGFSGDEWYFNSGVMILNLAQWRARGRSAELLECLEKNARYIWCWDQYALNVVFRQRWGRLPLRWNFGSHAYDYPVDGQGLHRGPLLPDEFGNMQQQPAVIHYTTEIKPWHYYCFHPLREKYHEFLDQTPWQGTRPSRPGFSTWWHVQTFKLQKRLLAAGRRMGW